MAGIDEKTSDDGEIIAQLKEKFRTANILRSEKVQILTVLPKSWSIRKIQTELGASNFTVRKAKALVAASGILTTPNPKPGRSLPQKTQDLVINFYEDDENSRLMPGKKDCVSVRRPQGRVTMQNRLVLTNLWELHRLFKDRHPEVKVGFSKFAELCVHHIVSLQVLVAPILCVYALFIRMLNCCLRASSFVT